SVGGDLCVVSLHKTFASHIQHQSRIGIDEVVLTARSYRVLTRALQLLLGNTALSPLLLRQGFPCRGLFLPGAAQPAWFARFRRSLQRLQMFSRFFFQRSLCFSNAR